MNPSVILATLNARYAHTSFGLRCLRANLGSLRDSSELHEFTIHAPAADIVETLLARAPRLIAFGVYIWNARETLDVVRLLKQVAPHVPLVLGGPEVSHETLSQDICHLAEAVIQGPGEAVLETVCLRLLSGERHPAGPLVVASPPISGPQLASLVPPYDEYSDTDIRQRLIYVEASRGCPFRCEFCLSSLDKTAYAFPLSPFLREMEKLYQRGVRQFKFIDRTFNLKVGHATAILDFFLEKLESDSTLALHFEMVPDRLPEALKSRLQRFPAGTLQLEIGLQTFTPRVQHAISRRQDDALTLSNLGWLRQTTHAHLHTDLIFGLPGETLDEMARGFDHLVALHPHEIQLGILKRLRGTPIVRHQEKHRLRFNPAPPYDLLCSDTLDFSTLQRLKRLARYWDLIGNSGRFPHTLALMLEESPFQHLLAFCDWASVHIHSTRGIAFERLCAVLYQWLAAQGKARLAHPAIMADYAASGARGKLVLNSLACSSKPL